MAPTREEFINEFNCEHATWASNPLSPSDVQKPSDEKIKSGWAIESPSHAFFNWYMNRTDKRLRELEARVKYLEEHDDI